MNGFSFLASLSLVETSVFDVKNPHIVSTHGVSPRTQWVTSGSVRQQVCGWQRTPGDWEERSTRQGMGSIPAQGAGGGGDGGVLEWGEM